MTNSKWLTKKGINDLEAIQAEIKRINETKSEEMHLLNKEYFDPKNDALTDEEKGPFVEYIVTRVVVGAPLNINGKRFGLKGDEQDVKDGHPSQREYTKAFVSDIKRYIK